MWRIRPHLFPDSATPARPEDIKERQKAEAARPVDPKGHLDARRRGLYAVPRANESTHKGRAGFLRGHAWAFFSVPSEVWRPRAGVRANAADARSC